MSDRLVYEDEPSSETPELPHHLYKTVRTVAQTGGYRFKPSEPHYGDIPDMLYPDTETSCLILTNEGQLKITGIDTLVHPRGTMKSIFSSKKYRDLGKACYMLKVHWKYREEDIEHLKVGLKDMKNKPHSTTAAEIEKFEAIIETMIAGATGRGSATHIGHGYLTTAAHCLVKPAELSLIGVDPIMMVQIIWGAGDINDTEYCKRLRSFDVELVAVSDKLSCAWDTATGIEYIEHFESNVDFAFLKLKNATDTINGKVFKFDSYVLPGRLAGSADQLNLGALVVNAHIGTQGYYRHFVQHSLISNGTVMSEADVRRALKRLLPGNIVLSRGTGRRSIGLLRPCFSTDTTVESSLAHAEGELIRHDCPTHSGASGGAIVDINSNTAIKSLGINISTELGEFVPGRDAYRQTPLHRNVAISWEGSLLRCFKSEVLKNVLGSADYPEVTRSWYDL